MWLCTFGMSRAKGKLWMWCNQLGQELFWCWTKSSALLKYFGEEHYLHPAHTHAHTHTHTHTHIHTHTLSLSLFMTDTKKDTTYSRPRCLWGSWRRALTDRRESRRPVTYSKTWSEQARGTSLPFTRPCPLIVWRIYSEAIRYLTIIKAVSWERASLWERHGPTTKAKRILHVALRCLTGHEMN